MKCFQILIPQLFRGYSRLRNRCRPHVYQFWIFFQALQSYQRVHKGYLHGYLRNRTCVFKALCLFFLPNFPGTTFIPCPTSIPEARVGQKQFRWFLEDLNTRKKISEIYRPFAAINRCSFKNNFIQVLARPWANFDK